VGEAARAAAGQQQGGQQLSDSKIRVVVRKRPINKKVSTAALGHHCCMCQNCAMAAEQNHHAVVGRQSGCNVQHPVCKLLMLLSAVPLYQHTCSMWLQLNADDVSC
jgi:hypothetical protein